MTNEEEFMWFEVIVYSNGLRLNSKGVEDQIFLVLAENAGPLIRHWMIKRETAAEMLIQRRWILFHSPSPVYPGGQGPHLGPEAESSQSTPG